MALKQLNTVHFTLMLKEHCLIRAAMGLFCFIRWHTHSDWLIAVMFARDIIFKPPPAGFEEEISNSISFEMKSDNLSAALTQALLNTCYQRHLTGGTKVPLLPLKYGEFSRDKSI